MPRFARFFAVALALGTLPSAVRAQAGAPAEPMLERRAMPAEGARPAVTTTAADPWLISYVGLSGRTARANIGQLDQALEPYRTSYTRLPADERARLRQAFDDLIPAQRFSRYPLSAPQARAIVYLALGPSEGRGRDRDCGGLRRRGGASRCDEAIDSMSRHAAWIHSTILAMGRTGNRRPRGEELGALRAMSEHAREMVVGASGCGCPAARDDAEALLTSTRDAVDVYEGSSMAAWMSLGDQRVQRISRLSDSLERTFIRCLGDG
jgi:hypothetical protein